MMEPMRSEGLTETLAGARAGLEEELRTILTRHHIPALDAEDLLHTTALEVLYQSPGVEEFTTRLGPALRHRCRRYWETRRWRFYERPQVRALGLAPSLPAPDREPPAAETAEPGRRRWLDRLLGWLGPGEEP